MEVFIYLFIYLIVCLFIDLFIFVKIAFCDHGVLSSGFDHKHENKRAPVWKYCALIIDGVAFT